MADNCPSAAQILAEWATDDPAAALERWRAGLERFESRSWRDLAELDEAAEFMCAGLACHLAGIPLTTAIGAITAVDAIGWPRWPWMNPTMPSARCS